ncbi:MAG TPA: T9SS type A sorting domain-containing protein, partial [Chitinophagales bacterium]|nr:T9SS type A sorting domain-containing protein [Chitinophagales bacterium]
NNCTATSNTVAVSVLPAPPVSISVNGDTLTSYNASGYQWYRDGVLIPGATSATYVTTQGGSYTVVVTGANGCTAQSLPVVVTGIDAITLQQQFSIYPNPLTGNNWTIEAGKDLMGARYTIFDNNGRLVYSSEIAAPKTTIDADMARGVYWLKVSSGAVTFTTKLVKL